MSQKSHSADIVFLQQVGVVLVFATMMAGAITLSLTLSERNLFTIASDQGEAMPSQLAMWQEASPLE